MKKIPKSILIGCVLLSVALISLILFNTSSSNTFKQAHKDARQRAQHIEKEIVHAQHTIQQTKFQLDSMEEHVNQLQAEQTRLIRTYNPHNPEVTYKLALERQQLNQLKDEYASSQEEKRKLEIELDSLSIYIQQNLY